jgi:hypothetical protein
MNFATIDSIVRRRLLETGYPIHYYFEYLVHAATCFRELNIDTLKIIKTVKLPVSSYFSVDLPVDFVDDLGLAIPAGQLLQSVPKRSDLTPLRNQDSDGAFAPYSADTEDENAGFGVPAFNWFWSVSDWGEPTGRFFGAGGGAKQNGYAVFKERRQIQLTETFTSDEVVLMYISDGQSVDNAAKVDMLAWSAINAYIAWKSSPSRDIKDSLEAATFYNERRLLRARLNDLTKTDILNILRTGYKASIKN